jgi:hypothetical protein
MRHRRVTILIGLMGLFLMVGGCSCRRQGSGIGESLDEVKEQQKPIGEQPPAKGSATASAPR